MLIVLLCPFSAVWAAVTTNVIIPRGFGSSVYTSSAFTIAAGSNRAAIIGVVCIGNGQTVTSSTLGGASGTVVANTNTTTTDGTYQTMMLSFINPSTGSQTLSVTWTGGVVCVFGGVVANGVDQTTPANNGTFQVLAFGNTPMSITSTNGDLTTSVCADALASVTTNQTLEWGSGTNQGGDIGPGTGTTSHQWSPSGNSHLVMSGANFKAAAAITSKSRGRIF